MHGFLLQIADGRVRMEPICLVSTVQLVVVVVVIGVVFLAHFHPLNTNQSWFECSLEYQC